MIDVTMMWKGLQKKIDAGLTEVLASEARLWSDELEVAGTVDCIGKFFGKYAIIDFKTSGKQKFKSDITGYFLQAAAYTQMWYERTGMKIDHLIVLIATEETNKTYLFYEPADVWIPKFKELRETYRKIYNL
jgi:ATP-dependent exoDNAse (exonuclease V) beta subunit